MSPDTLYHPIYCVCFHLLIVCVSITCSEADGDQPASSKESTAAVRGGTSSKKTATISEVEDDSERAASSHEGGQSKMASCQDHDNMEDSVGLASGENKKKASACLDNIDGGRSLGKKESEDRESTHRHNKSSKRKHKKTSLKLKLKKTVSKARLKSYGISV